MGFYAYEALQFEKQELRLIEVFPSRVPRARLRCRLLTFSIQDAPHYDALSYTWGNDRNSCRIELNGDRFWVSRNLHDALRRFRLTREVRLLWADAISINQADKVELGQQVRIMPEIYRRASHVRIWIGAGDKQSNLAMRYLSILGADFGKNVDGITLSSLKRPDENYIDSSKLPELLSSHENEILKQSDPLENLAAVAEVPRLLSRPWFHRVWIVQEIAMSGAATVYCGDLSISWRTLVKAAEVFSCWDQFGRPIIKNQPKERTRGMDIIREGTQSFVVSARNINTLDTLKMFQERPSPLKPHNPRLEDVFAHMRERGTSDARDRIYAAASLLPFENTRTIDPDYTVTEREVFEKVASFFLHHGSLRFLQYCQPHLKSSELPSWVPDWSQPGATPPLQDGMFTSYYRRYNTSGKAVPKYYCARLKDNDPHLFLVAAGKTVDRVATITCDYNLDNAQSPHWEEVVSTCATGQLEVNDPIIHLSDTESTPEDLPEVDEPKNNSVRREEEMKQSIYKSGCSLWEAYIRTLIADRIASNKQSDSVLFALDLVREAKRYKNSHFNWSPYLMTRLPESVTTKALITTETQYVGLGPEYAEPGDYVVVLYGMEVPLILRKSKNRDIYYIIGEAYIHGIMDGELFEHRSLLEEQNGEDETFVIC